MKCSSLIIFIDLLFLLLFAGPVNSQTVHISGKVINEKNEALERVFVTIRYTGEGRIVAYTLTSESGNFELKRDLNAIHPDSLELNFSYLGYAPQTRRIPGKGQPLLIELTESKIELREVVVSPQKILQRSDTIIYVVSSFSSLEDRTIGDVLKKLPGIEVLQTGQIRYQGQYLNKFYIEGSDLLGGRYGLATNNISHRDIARVEIMENHQPIQALRDLVFSDAPAMNIILNEDAKSRWAGTVKGGAGIPELWTTEVFAMKFNPKTQTLNTYKGNNTGNESYEMNLLILPSDLTPNFNPSLSSYIHVSPSVAGDIGSSRSTFNQTNNLTSNNLIKIKKDFDLIAELTGSFDRRESEYLSQTIYFLGNEQVSIEDKTEDANNLKKAFTGAIRLKSNQKRYYLNNRFDFSYDRNDPSIHTIGTYPNNQKARIENRKVSNDFDILRRTGNNYFTFRSNNEYSSKPQFLEVAKNGQPPVRENIGLSSIYSNNSFDYSIKIGKFRIQNKTGLLYQHRQIENERNEQTNSLNTDKLRLDFTSGINFDLNDFRIALSGVLYYQSLSLEKQKHHFWGVNPHFSVNWTMTSRLTTSANISYSKVLPDESLFYHGNIMNSYRSLTAGYIDFSTGKSANFSAKIAYKDVIKILFADLGVSFSKRRHPKIPGQDFIDDYILSYYDTGNMTTEMLSVSGSLSKGIEFIRGVAIFSPLFIRSKSGISRNGITIPYSSDSYIFRYRINSQLIKNCDVTYDVSYRHNKNRMESDRQYFSSTRLSESIKVTYSPIKILQMGYTLEHYCNELTSNNYKNFILSDFFVSYLAGTFSLTQSNRWEFACLVKNIFNESYYSYFIENELTSFYRSYTIRPRNVLISATYRF